MTKRLKKETSLLNKYELNVLLPILVKALEMKRGKKNAITGKEITEGLINSGVKANETQVCRIIYHIRMNDIIAGLMGSRYGYYISNSAEELMHYENNLLKRERALKEVRMSIKRQRRILHAQLAQKQIQLF